MTAEGDHSGHSSPTVLRVTVDDAATRSLSADTEPTSAVISFSSLGELRDVLTERRIAVLQALLRTSSPIESIDVLAEDLDLDEQTIREDLTVLEEHGLVNSTDDGQSRQPLLPFNRIHLDVELASAPDAERPAQLNHTTRSETITDTDIAALREEIRGQHDDDQASEGGSSDSPSWLGE